MDGNRIAAVLVAVLMVTSMMAIPGVAIAQDDEPDATEPASYFGNVTVDGDPAPNGTNVSVAIDGEVQDSLTVNETGQYGGPDLFDEKLTVDDAEENDTVEFLVDGEPVERTDPETVEWTEGDVKQVNLLDTVVDPITELELVDAPPENVTAGDDIRFTVNVTNTGASGDVEINVTADDEDGVLANETIEDLDTNASTNRRLSVDSDDIDGDTADLTVETDDDEIDLDPVDIKDAANFEVDLAVDDPEDDGDQYDSDEDDLNGTVTVNNTGDQSDEQNVTVTFNDEELTDELVELDGGADTDVEFDRELTADDAGENTVEAASEDDDDSVDIVVTKPGTFAVDVIDGESDLEVVAGQNATIVAEIENIGEEEATQDVTLTNVTDDPDEELADEEFTLDPGEIADDDFEAEIETDGSDANRTLEFEVASEDETETVTIDVEERDAFLDVTIDEVDPDPVDEPASGETEVDVDVTVENLGDENATQDITFTADGEEFGSNNTEVGDDPVTLNETLTIERGDAPEVDIEVASENSTAEETLDVTPLGEFDVSIVESSNVSEPVAEDEPFAPEINVTNVGEQNAEGELEVLFNGTSIDNVSTDGEINPGEEKTLVEENGEFAINASEEGIDPGNILLEAAITNNETDETDDSSTDRVRIGEASELEVEEIDLNGDDVVDRGDQISADVTINNTGDVDSGSETVIVELGDREITIEDEQRNSSEAEELSVEFTTRGDDVGTNNLTVTTPDDEDSEAVTVREDAEFLIDDFEFDEDGIAGEEIEATANIENVGGNASNTTDVSLFVDGADDPDDKSIELAAGEEDDVTFNVTPDEAGTLEATVATGDDFDTETTEVGTPGELVTEIRSVTDPVQNEEDVEVRVDLENIGDGEVDETVELYLDGSFAEEDVVELDGGESDRLTLSTEVDIDLPEGESTEETVEVRGGVEDVEETFTVEEPEAPFFRVSSLDITDDDVLNQSQTLNVTANVTNIGDETDTQNITFDVGDVSKTNESIELENGSQTTVDFGFDPTDVGETGEDIEYEVASDNQTANDTLTIREPEPGTPAIVDVDFDESATQEEPFEANVTVENVGDLNLSETEGVTLEYAGDDGFAANETEELGENVTAGDETAISVTVEPPAEPRAGVVDDREFTVEVGDEAVTETVPVDFEGIQSGVDAANDGDTVTLEPEPETYEERRTVTVDTANLTIEPAEGDVVIESPRRDDTAFAIEESGVELSDLTLAGDGNGTAVELAGDADDATLVDLRIEDWETGVDETAGEHDYVGLDVVDVETGLAIDGAEGSSVEFTRVSRADDAGVFIASNDTEVFSSSISRAPIGIDAVAQATIEETSIRNADEYGLRVTDVPEDDGESASFSDGNLESNSLSVLADDSTVNASSNWWGTDIPQENDDWAERSEVITDDPAETRQDSDFTVDVTQDAQDPVVRGESFDVEATIENEGNVTDRQNIELVDDGDELDTTVLNLSGGENESVTLSYEPTSSDVASGNLDLEVQSLDDEDDARNVSVVDPAEFEVEITDADTDVPLGEDLDVDVNVTNVGGIGADATVELLDFDGNEVVDEDVTIGDGDDVQETLTWETDETGTGDITVNVTDDEGVVEDTDTEEVTVEDAALDDVTLELDDTTLDVGDDTTATVTAAFTDGSEIDVTTEGDTEIESDDEDVASVNGDTITAEGDGTATITAEHEANGETESDTVELTVEEDDPAPTGVGTGAAPIIPDDDVDDIDDLDPDAVESESVTPELDPETDRQVATFEEVETVSEISFETADDLDEVTVGDLDPETEEVTPPGASATLTQILVSDEATDTAATVEFRVSAERLDAIDADADDLTAFRAGDEQWEALETTVEETDDGAVVSAETPGFSVFAVSATSEPDAEATATPETAEEGEEITLDGSESSDRYGDIIAYEWEINGETADGETATVTLDPGDYTVELTVTNDAGETNTDTVDVTVEAVDDEPPEDPPEEEPEEEEFGIGLIAVIVLIILALIAAAAVILRDTEE